MTAVVVAIFAVVYLSMIIGRFPGLALDRTGAALLGACALVACGAISIPEAAKAIDLSTILLLFGLMIVSAQFRVGGFYADLTARLERLAVPPPVLLAVLIVTVGVLSALLTNDIVCLILAPLLIEVCSRRQLAPTPFLLALACSANVGSAATLIGNPQNILIGQQLHLSFGGYLLDAGVPAALGLGVIWALIAWRYRGRWEAEIWVEPAPPQPMHRWQNLKGLAILLGLVAAFLFTPLPRDLLVLGAAGLLLISRTTTSRSLLDLVDWPLLVLFMGLFVVNHALQSTHLPDQAVAALAARGVDLDHPPVLMVVTVLLSNLVSNVPAVMLLIPEVQHPAGGAILALASTLAGNLLIVGSIANLIVVDAAAHRGVKITAGEHARIGVPVTILALLLAAGWLTVRGVL